VLLLDEPSSGIGAAELPRLEAAVRACGVTVVLVEHNLRFVSALADRVTVLDEGRVIDAN
jgi:ABC-type branched-subunit amino acid transport system ATPase component